MDPQSGETNVASPKREIVAGSGPRLTQQTQALLRLRLRASAFIMLVGFAVFLVRHIVGKFAGEPRDAWLLGAHITVVIALAGIFAWLYRKRAATLGQLRVAELAIFGLPGAFFLLLQQRVMSSDVSRSYLPPPIPFWLCLIFTYALFIPSGWRRAALVIGAMALAPSLLLVGMSLASEQVAERTSALVVLQNVLIMAVAAGAAVLGAHLIHTLRREVFEAKQLAQYRLLAPLGAGGMGAVFLAEHLMLKRPCAIKLIRPEQAGDRKALARFEREVQTTARLSHWNTIEIYDYGRTEDGAFFYVMEYLPGMSLEELLVRYGAMPPERVAHFLVQACRALKEAHAIGLIHRDIKPGNIFAAQRGGEYDVAKLLDFGLVKPVAEMPSARISQEGGVSGTPLFMSPEQARGLDELDARSDIYSLGCVAYDLLTGRPPFDRGSPMDVMIAHARDEVVPPSQVHADVPADLERVVLRCLAKRPEDRFPDAASLENALAQCGVAGKWTQEHAARWWREHDLPATAEEQIDRVTTQLAREAASDSFSAQTVAAGEPETIVRDTK
jgi:serine/threonine-protein kinase